MYVYVCMCACVCERDRERDRERIEGIGSPKPSQSVKSLSLNKKQKMWFKKTFWIVFVSSLALLSDAADVTGSGNKFGKKSLLYPFKVIKVFTNNWSHYCTGRPQISCQ